MSIATKTGDEGKTGLMFNRRVSKCDLRVEAYGSVDELNAALGLARALTGEEFVRQTLLWVQKDLIVLMGELATATEDRERYVREGYSLITPEATAKLDRLVSQLESENVTFAGWAVPGERVDSAALEVARTTCRRAERRVCALGEAGGSENAEIVIYLNRLADGLWLLARWLEAQGRPGAAGGQEGT